MSAPVMEFGLPAGAVWLLIVEEFAVLSTLMILQRYQYLLLLNKLTEDFLFLYQFCRLLNQDGS